MQTLLSPSRAALIAFFGPMLAFAVLSALLLFIVALTNVTFPSGKTLLEPAAVAVAGCALYAVIIALRQRRASTWASRFSAGGTACFRGLRSPLIQLLNIETSPYPAVYFESEDGIFRLSGVLLHGGIDINSLELVGRFEPTDQAPRLESVRHHTFILSRELCVATSVLVFRSQEGHGVISYISEEDGKTTDFWCMRESVQAAIAEMSPS